MRAIWVFTLLMLLVWIMDARPNEFAEVDKKLLDVPTFAKKYKMKVHNLIVKATGERILVDPNNYGVTSVVFVVRAPYESVRDALRAIVARRMRIASDQESIADESQRLINTLNRGLKEMYLRDLNQLRALGIKLDEVRQVRITGQYNTIEKIKGYSKLRLTVIDGHEVLQKGCTLVLMRRTDFWRDWGREWHTGIPIPIKITHEGDVVTNTEIGLMKDLQHMLDIKDLKYFVPRLPYEPLLDVEMMRTIKAEEDTW